MARFTEGLESIPHISEKKRQGEPALPLKYEVSRPFFLELTPTQFDNSKDHGQRLVLIPNNLSRMPWYAGYAETINSGKSIYVNEDQASIQVTALSVYNSDDDQITTVPYIMFGVFDGHAGTGAAVMAAHTLHKHIRDKFDSIKHFLVQETAEVIAEDDPGLGCITEPIPKELLVIGSLEESFVEMDEQIRAERNTYLIKGGCTAMVALFMQNKLYVANAGDCRAVLLLDNLQKIHPMSQDFTPETDRQRLQKLAYLQPQLLGKYFGRLEYQRRLRKKDIGQRILYRDRHMVGWAYRTVTEEDINLVPMIIGHGKRARLMATIGTTRGFGDHDLEAPGGQFIKPLLSPIPEVRVWNLDEQKYTENDVLVIATDGLWERLTNEEALEVVQQAVERFPCDDKLYTNIAKELVTAARGMFGKKGWRTAKEQSASCDDISCFVIPLNTYMTTPKPGCLGEALDHLIDMSDPIKYSSGATDDFIPVNDDASNVR
jgi:serine/threonine protein phosphatase PrpC